VIHETQTDRTLVFILGLIFATSLGTPVASEAQVTQQAHTSPCAICQTCGWRKHALQGDEPTGDVIGATHECMAASSCGVHGSCGGSALAPIEVESSLQQLAIVHDPDAFLELLRPIAGQSTVSESRNAIMMSNCDGDIVAFVPITGEQVQIALEILPRATSL
jgi:hypothetical protein